MSCSRFLGHIPLGARVLLLTYVPWIMTIVPRLVLGK